MQKAIVTSRLALRMPSDPAGPEDAALAQDLIDTLVAHAHECVGLAANMVGVRKRIIAVDNGGSPLAMLNPQVVERSGAYQTEEGCLSLPGRRATLRYRNITVRWQDAGMAWHERRFSGQTAQAIQHEVDHCDGILI